MMPRLRHGLARLLGRTAQRLGLPGAVADLDYHDHVTGQRLKIETGPFLTCLTINGREFYFKRFSGKLDGTGMTLHPPRNGKLL